MVSNTETRLAASGIELPPAPPPFGAYVPAVQTGNLLFLTGMLPTVGHEAKFLARAPRIKVFDVAETDRAEEEETAVAAAKSSGGVVVDWNITGTL